MPPQKKMLRNSVSEAPIKNKIWAVLSEIGLSRILSQWNMLNKFEYEIMMLFVFFKMMFYSHLIMTSWVLSHCTSMASAC